MPYGIYISAEGATVQAQRLDVIANNMANADTPGFKQDVPTFQARFAEAIQKGMATPGSGSINDVGGGVKLHGISTDFSIGEIKRTGNNLDLAICGKGFFQVHGDDGEDYLTRAGEFGLDQNGKLVTQNGGRAVLDQSGNEIVLNPNLPYGISDDGFISQQGSLIPIGISEPDSLNEMTKVGNNMWKPRGTVNAVQLGDRNVRQGYVEVSGSSPVRQMMAMIETTRAFEANSRMIQNQDSVLGTLIGRVLQP